MKTTKKALLQYLTLALMVTPMWSIAQKGKSAAASAGSGAKTSTTAPTGGTTVSGFSYLLPKGYSMEYRTLDISKPVIIPITADAAAPSFVNHSVLVYQAKGWYLNFDQAKDTGLVKMSFRDITRTLYPPDGRTYTQFGWGTFKRIRDSMTKVVVATAYPLRVPPNFVQVSTRIATLDTIDRYYLPTHRWGYHLLHRHWKQVLDFNRARVSITQADSGRLNIEVDGGDYPASFNDKDIRFITYLPTNEFSPGIPITGADSAKNFFLRSRRAGRLAIRNISLNFITQFYNTVQ